MAHDSGTDLKPGSRLGDFEIVSLLGAGGMGAVYRARDTKLGREVALKVIHPRLAGPEAALRFEREARLLASLNHPHIATIHGFEQSGGIRFAILELVDGDTLGDWVEKTSPSLDAALGIAIQIAEALEAAHAARVIHRDLKPSNVKVTPAGRVKVLDFGIARALGPDTTGVDAETAETRAAGMTAAGRLLGTPGYMSPEQARGLRVGEAADLWAFGCLLFEMLAGRRAFPGPTAADALAATLRGSPDWAALPADVPPAVRAVLDRCLEKDAAPRTITAADARREITAVLDAGKSGGRAVRHPRLTQITFADELEGMPAWSPRGDEIAFTRETEGVRKIFRQRIGADALQATAGPHDDIQPSWSPDGGTLLFVRARPAGRRLEPADLFGAYDDGDIWSLDVAAGRESRWLEGAFNPAWSPHGDRVAVDASWAGPRRLWVIDRRGHNPAQISEDASEAVAHVRPRWSPDGRRLVYQKIERTRLSVGAVDLASRRSVAVTDSPWNDLNPCWSARRRHVYFSSYRSGGLNVWRVGVGDDGSAASAPEQVTTGAGQDLEVAPSPDGSRLALSILKQNASIWALPVEPASGRPAGAPRKIIATSREDSRAAWSPDGRRIAFNSDRAGAMNIWVHDLAAGASRQVTEGPGGDYQASWSPDGRALAFFSSRARTPGIWTVDLASGALTSLSPPACIEINPFFSPDGRLIAYQSDREGRFEVWVMRADGSEPRCLTSVGVTGHFLRFTRDGRFVIFRRPGARPATLRVPVEGGEPEAMGEIAGGAHMSLSPDASRILDVVGHKTLHVSPIGGAKPEAVFEFDDHEVRIDYPVWSPDGTLVSFDRFLPRGGDVWMLEEFE
ncbi:MAG: serine/threonine-protein kinase [Acidobacteria bacterium]|nr:serine/threonine-protein kinase [Acidobacteriota bacterium]